MKIYIVWNGIISIDYFIIIFILSSSLSRYNNLSMTASKAQRCKSRPILKVTNWLIGQTIATLIDLKSFSFAGTIIHAWLAMTANEAKLCKSRPITPFWGCHMWMGRMILEIIRAHLTIWSRMWWQFIF